MFALTRRLTLRPLWPEETGALALLPATPDHAVMISCAIATRDGALPQTIGLVRIAVGTGGTEVSLAIVPDARGHGYATEAAGAVLAAARWSMGIRRLTARIAEDDRVARQLARKLGFVATYPSVPRRTDDRMRTYAIALMDSRTAYGSIDAREGAIISKAA